MNSRYVIKHRTFFTLMKSYNNIYEGQQFWSIYCLLIYQLFKMTLVNNNETAIQHNNLFLSKYLKHILKKENTKLQIFKGVDLGSGRYLFKSVMRL